MPRQYLKKRFNSFGYAIKGIATAFASEPNMRIHILAAVAAISLGWFFHIKTSEWCWIILAIGMVWMAEIFNTAVEKLTDLASPDYHELAGQAKDLAAGAVLIAAITSLAIGVLIFYPHVVALPLMQEWTTKFF